MLKRADTKASPDGSLNQQRVMYYSANWQLLEERIDDDLDAHEPDGDDRKMQYFWGPRYIDDIIARKQTNLHTENSRVWYHLTDALFSTVAIITDAAFVVERISYDPYGKARHHRMADLNSDGNVDGLDQAMLYSNWGSFGTGDLNRDGTVDGLDILALNSNWGAAEPHGRLSRTSGGRGKSEANHERQ